VALSRYPLLVSTISEYKNVVHVSLQDPGTALLVTYLEDYQDAHCIPQFMSFSFL
jgi:hypothetical protein